MIQIDTPFRWTGNTERAAELAAEDRLDDAAIAAECGVKRNTLARWRRHPDFRTRITEHVTAQRAALKAEGIANRQNRLDMLNDLADRLLGTILDRAADPSMADVPAGPRGTQVRTYKGLGRGDDFRIVEEYASDMAPFLELRGTLKQAAQEVGEWEEKSSETVHAGEGFLQALRLFAGGVDSAGPSGPGADPDTP